MNKVSRRSFLKKSSAITAASVLMPRLGTASANTRPNILWIVSEDNSPFVGCYGDELAVTPHLDELASEGFLYTHAYANAPVCAPARNTIITGVYACSNGHQHMRSGYLLSEEIRLFPVYLKELGYYCTNNSKEDYNLDKPKDPKENPWDESSKEAHYSNRKSGQPFFHIKNIGTSHESSIHKSVPTDQLSHKPAEMKLPPYHPDTPDIRHDWAQYYDKITAMDEEVGEVLAQLERDGLAGDTVVFYYGDHGGVLARSKRYVYESGTHVPFILRIPEKYKHLYPAEAPGSQVNRLISFVDLAPTMLSITGVPVPGYMQGGAFLGGQKTKDPRYAFMFRGRMDERYDMCRAVRDDRYRYIRNYMPFRIYGQPLEYLWRAPATRSWEQAYKDGKCDEIQSIFWNTKPIEELYDTENDPWEVKNLAGNPAYRDILKRMRAANKKWITSIYDAGFIPEADRSIRAGKTPFYDYMRSDNVDLEALIEAAETASLGDPDNLKQLIAYLKDDDSAIRYWGATGLLILGAKAKRAKRALLKALDDEYPNVVVVAAEALYGLGEKEAARKGLLRAIAHPEEKARCHAFNAVQAIGEDSPEIQQAAIDLVLSGKKGSRSYDERAANYLLDLWGVDMDKLWAQKGK